MDPLSFPFVFDPQATLNATPIFKILAPSRQERQEMLIFHVVSEGFLSERCENNYTSTVDSATVVLASLCES